MHYTFRAKLESRVPEESRESNILFGRKDMRPSEQFVMEQVVIKVGSTCFKIEERAQVCDWETLQLYHKSHGKTDL